MTATTMTASHIFADASQSSVVLGAGQKAQFLYYFPRPDLGLYSPLIQETTELVRELGKLDSNWNGYGAKPVNKEAVDKAVSFLVVLAALGQNVPEPYVSPKENGTVALSWETDSAEAYIEFGVTRYSGYISSRSSGDSYFEGTDADVGRDFAVATQEKLYATNTRLFAKPNPLLGWVGDETSAVSFISICQV